jgi:hypothetical protein
MNTQFPNQSATLSLMVSRATYRAVVGVENMVRFGANRFRSAR